MGRYTVSVRALAEFACLTGRIASASASRMREGREGHEIIEKLLGPAWACEVKTDECFSFGEISLHVQGRADAVLETDDMLSVAEIKTVRRNPDTVLSEDYPVHWAQAEIYAYLLCRAMKKDGAAVILIYAGTNGGLRRFKRELNRRELEERFNAYAAPYVERLKGEEDWHAVSAPTLRCAAFPFDTFRDGQKEMASYVYAALTQGRRTLIEAPTGIGKTAASLYGAVQALGTGKITRIFYLTARTTGRAAAEYALSLMRKKGLRIRSVTLTAKEKICPKGKADCFNCPMSDSYFSRRHAALREAMLTESFTEAEVRALAEDHELCPFELSLDITELSDVIICDYNYVFDPRVRLKRHFERKSGIALLIDEAHNLPERAREMYSVTLDGARVGKMLEGLADGFGEEHPLCAALSNLLSALTREDGEYDVMSSVPGTLSRAADAFAEICEKLRSRDEQLEELRQDCARFAKTALSFDDECMRMTVTPLENGRTRVKLWCFAPEKHLEKMFRRVGGAALFSATLAPMDFYARMLCVHDKDALLKLPSPFPEENLFVARLPVSVRYRDRQDTCDKVCRILHAMTRAHTGNYMACFPSYAYLDQILRYYLLLYPGERVAVQETYMSEKRRREFIDSFTNAPETSMLAFVVLGGVFAEGVDLPEDRLSGAAVISTGMPQVNAESELLRELYDDGEEFGYDTAYTYPGFRRVLQAAGRVIRTEKDRGTVLLLDDRYAAEKFQTLFPEHWHVRRIGSMSALNAQLRAFWGENDKQ